MSVKTTTKRKPPTITEFHTCLHCEQEIPAAAWKLTESDKYEARCPACKHGMELWIGRYTRSETDAT